MIQKITDDIKYKEYKKVFANNLKRFREREGLTQEQLAEKLNVDPTTISRYETAKRELTTSMIPHICSVLHITPHELFGLNTSEQKNDGKNRPEDLVNSVQFNAEFIDDLINYLTKLRSLIK